jgi:hypothetical protein
MLASSNWGAGADRTGDNMAEIDGMLIVDQSSAPGCGGAFTLAGASPVSETVELDRGWTLEVRSGSRVAVARGATAGNYQATREEALRCAHQGLDLLSIRGVADLQIVRAFDEHLTWWAGRGGTTLRATSIATATASVGAKFTVTDALGRVKPDPPAPHVAWHESFTYFRMAELTDDLFDAFRNRYLALESVLSTIAPINPREREGDWLKRAVRVADTVTSLQPFAPKGAGDPVSAISQDLRDARNAVFHAKSNRQHFAPSDWSDRPRVLASLKRMTKIYLVLVKAKLGFSRPSSGFFASGVRLLTKHLDKGLVIQATDDSTAFQVAQTVVNPGGGRVVSLSTRPAPELNEAFLRSFIGRAPVAQLSALTHVSRIASTYEGEPLTAGILEGRLTLGGVDHFEAHMGIRVRNKQQPRDLYSG